MNHDLPARLLELKTRFDDRRITRRSSRAKNLWAKWMITLSFVIAPFIITVRYSAQSERQSASTPHAVYDSNPDHLLTEDVQIRVHRAISKTIPEGFNFDSNAERTAQDFFEIKLSRAKLFAGHSGGLRALARDEEEFLLFQSHGDDPFDRVKENESMERGRITTLKLCVYCHFSPGIHSMNSHSELMGAEAALIASDINNETKVTIGWKQTNQAKYDWRLLQRLWRASPPRETSNVYPRRGH